MFLELALMLPLFTLNEEEEGTPKVKKLWEVIYQGLYCLPDQ